MRRHVDACVCRRLGPIAIFVIIKDSARLFKHLLTYCIRMARTKEALTRLTHYRASATKAMKAMKAMKKEIELTKKAVKAGGTVIASGAFAAEIVRLKPKQVMTVIEAMQTIPNYKPPSIRWARGKLQMKLARPARKGVNRELFHSGAF